ncbi:MAG: hypothetical protein Phyf2KO_17490 [Phycisphaerales bacterium]
MDTGTIVLIVIGAVALVAVLFVAVEKAAGRAREISASGGDTAKGWIIRCTKCESWRPATEAGIIRFGAASKGKRTATRCSACGELCLAAIEKGPGPEGMRRIDEHTNRSIYPETLTV